MHKAHGYWPLAILGAIIFCTAPVGAGAQSEPPSADAQMTGRVKAALAADPHLLARHIDVSVKNGVVHLGGLVESSEDVERALEDAHAVPGVVNVENEMELKRGQSRGTGT